MPHDAVRGRNPTIANSCGGSTAQCAIHTCKKTCNGVFGGFSLLPYGSVARIRRTRRLGMRGRRRARDVRQMADRENQTEGVPLKDDGRRLQRSDWIAAARAALMSTGYATIKIGVLAKSLAVTRGSFYWHFANRAELLDSLIADWETNNSAAIFSALEQPGPPAHRLRKLGRVWLDECGYSPAYDSAVRDWARVSPKVQEAVHRVDNARIAAFEALFTAAGYPAGEAFIRARITYFHQVGYYAMGIREPTALRDNYLDLYISVLLGTSEKPPAA